MEVLWTIFVMAL